MKSSIVRNCSAVIFGTFMLVGTVGLALAKENKTVNDGWNACVSWCDAHNKTQNSRDICYKNCEKYWKCNGSDSTPELCSSAAAAAIVLPPKTGVVTTPPTQVIPKAPVTGNATQRK